MPFIGDLEFTKVTLSTRSIKPTMNGTIRARNKQVTFNLSMIQQLGWQEGDRLDLLQSGKIFAFEKSPTGLFELKKSAPSAKTLLIRSTNLDRHIRTAVGLDECVVFTAHIDGERIIFYKGDE